MPRALACELARVQEDIRDHSLTIVRDDGAEGRHLRFRSTTRGSAYWFDLITWAGTLVIDGDCGTYVFRRMPDMFTFFRHDPKRGIEINPGYWAEKVQAQAVHGGVKKFSLDTFKADVKYFVDHWAEGTEDAALVAGVREALADRMSYMDEDEIGAWSLIRDFEHEGFRFRDWERSCEEFDFQYLWCLWAIVLGIAKYDALKAAGREAANDDGSERVAA